MDRKWWLVILGCITHAVNTGFSYFGMSAFFPSIEREFGWSRTAISGAFSLARIESGLLGPIEGYFVDRVGPRRIMYIGIVICVLGFVSLSLVNSLPMLYVAIVLGIVLGSSLGYHMPISLLIAKIFHERRSLAFGIFRMGPGLSGAIVPLVGAMIVWWGWRTAAVLSGCMLLLAGLPIAYLINRIAQTELRDRELAAATNSEIASTAHRSLPQFTLKEALGLKTFWFFSVAMALRHMVTEGVSVHFVILLVDRGWSTEAASSLLGVSALIGAPTRIGMGWLGDLLDKRKLVIGLLLALGASVGVMGWAGSSFVFTAFMVIYSLAYGGLASLQEPIRADYFGTKAFATIQGVSRSITTAGTFLGPVVAGLFYDFTKSYSVAFTIFAIVSLLSTLLMFLARPPVQESTKPADHT
ncbi:MAG TPA: MFS transporter [Candidatus Binatia bacterium]|jgi:MFS family permease|nr:MFS transporter [Candidatus Binatia bacterium]